MTELQPARIRIERRGALTGPKVVEIDLAQLAPEARAALAGVLAEPVAAIPPPQGGDRSWYRLTLTGPGGAQVRDVGELPTPLRKLPQFAF